MRAALIRTGLATSLGTHAPSVCAAIRAGITRPRSIEGILAFDPASPGDALVVGHPAALGMTDGYQIPARWLRMLRAACADEIALAGTRPEERDGPTWLCLPSPDEPRFADGLYDPGWFAARMRDLLERRTPVTVVMQGVAGFWSTLGEACRRINAGEVSRATLLVVDSLLDAESLEWLAKARRLKTPEQPTGIAPGEAAACLVLERTGDVAVSAVSQATEDREDVRLGGARALSAALAATIATGSAAGITIGNHNGEEARAFAWGFAQNVLASRGVQLAGAMHPAASLGDVGMCAPAVGVALAAAAHRRHWAGARSTAVWSIDGGKAGACLVAGQWGE